MMTINTAMAMAITILISMAGSPFPISRTTQRSFDSRAHIYLMVVKLCLMLDYFKQILTAQFEAALCMMNQCIEACAPEHWEGKIANDTFRQVSYHTLFFADLYLSPNENAFELRDLNHRGGDERGPTLSPGLARTETLSYLEICRQKMLQTLAAETSESLQGPCGFSWRK